MSWGPARPPRHASCRTGVHRPAPLYLPYISPISPLYLPCISPISAAQVSTDQHAVATYRSGTPNPHPNPHPNPDPDPNPNPNPNPNPKPFILTVAPNQGVPKSHLVATPLVTLPPPRG